MTAKPGHFRLLPALPKAWPSGTIEGVLCRGQIEIEYLHWENGVIQAAVTSATGQQVEFVTPAEMRKVTFAANKPMQFELKYLKYDLVLDSA